MPLGFEHGWSGQSAKTQLADRARDPGAIRFVHVVQQTKACLKVALGGSDHVESHWVRIDQAEIGVGAEDGFRQEFDHLLEQLARFERFPLGLHQHFALDLGQPLT